MEYFLDQDLKYKDDMLAHLRAYNLAKIGPKDKDKAYFYVLEGDKTVGRATASLNWDWVGLDDIEYDKVQTLGYLLASIVEGFKTRAVGYKYYANLDEDRLTHDLRAYGFSIAGTLEASPRVPGYHMLKATDMSLHVENVNKPLPNLRVIHSPKAMVTKDQVTEQPMEQPSDTSTNQPSDQPLEDTLFYVATHDDHFVGGIYGIVNEDTLYISWLVVDERFRLMGVGQNLMGLLEEGARARNLYRLEVGTADFQAPHFYQKLGFNIVLVKEDEPKGHVSYSLFKYIR